MSDVENILEPTSVSSRDVLYIVACMEFAKHFFFTLAGDEDLESSNEFQKLHTYRLHVISFLNDVQTDTPCLVSACLHSQANDISKAVVQMSHRRSRGASRGYGWT